MWRGFFLGLGLFMALAGLAYLTPLRQILVQVAGNDFPALKEIVQVRYQALEEREQRIIASPETVTDTLRASQEKAWREYAAQRDNLTKRIQAQSTPSLHGLLDWVTELWIWLAVFWIGLPLGGALLGRSLWKKFPRGTDPVPAPGGDTARFQAVLGKIAEVSASSRNSTKVRVSPVEATLVVAHPGRTARPNSPAAHPEPPPVITPHDQKSLFRTFPPTPTPSDYPGPIAMNRVPQPEAPPGPIPSAVVSPNLFREPEPEPKPEPKTVPFVFQPEVRETPKERDDTPMVQSPNALIMEDEPAAHAGAAESTGEEDPPWGRLPETTEFEHLERQREEVLRCARKGMTSSEIARRLRISQDQVDLMIRMHRDRGGR